MYVGYFEPIFSNLPNFCNWTQTYSYWLVIEIIAIILLSTPPQESHLKKKSKARNYENWLWIKFSYLLCVVSYYKNILLTFSLTVYDNCLALVSIIKTLIMLPTIYWWAFSIKLVFIPLLVPKEAGTQLSLLFHARGRRKAFQILDLWTTEHSIAPIGSVLNLQSH